MIISEAARYRIAELLSITSSDIDELYKKFGLTDERFDLETQMKAIVSFNDILTEDILNEVYNKYNVPECREFMELKRKAPKISRKQKLEEHEALTSFIQTVKKEWIK